jgi:hypothetical protein
VERFMNTWNARAIVAFQDDSRRILPGGLEPAEPAPAEEAEPAEEEGETARREDDADGPHAVLDTAAPDADRLALLGGSR